MTDLLDRMQGYENWQRGEASSLRKYSKSPSMPELAEMHEETADALKDARIEIERLRVAVNDARNGAVAASECAGRMMEDRDEAFVEIERLRAERDAAYKIGGEALLHALHPEFGSIYDADGEATAAFNKGRLEGIEAAARIIEARAYECVVEAAAWQRDVPEARDAMVMMESRAKTLENTAAEIRRSLARKFDND